jgi:hypothetical protein
MRSKNKMKSKRKTMKGGLFNKIKVKSKKDNIKDWYLYWKSKGYTRYDDQYRYPGYFNVGLFPIRSGRLIENDKSIDNIPKCNSELINNDFKINHEHYKNLDLCGANITGTNRLYYDSFWACKERPYDPNFNWVQHTIDSNDVKCHRIDIRKSDYAPDISNMKPGEWPK